MTTLQTYESRWKSGAGVRPHAGAPPDYVAGAKPTALVEYRTGRLKHGYSPWDGPPIGALVAGGYVRDPGDPTPSGWPISGYGRLYWQNTWTPDDGADGVFAALPNVLDWNVQQSFDNNGIKVLTLTVENIAYPQVTGPRGVYHSIKRGYYAPKRGFHAPGMAALSENGHQIDPNEWYGRFNSGGQIRVWHGYGDAQVPEGTFLIDDIDTKSRPDQIVITARDYGQALTDMRVFGWNKEPRILDPLVFIDRLQADHVTKVGFQYRASSTHGDHKVENMADTDSDTFWLSDGHNGRNFTEWIEIELPGGRYEDFYLFPRQRGMEIFVSVFSPGSGSTLDGNTIPEGWVDVGNGDVPGGNGGIPYVHHRKGLDAKGVYVGLKGVYELKSGGRIRVHFRDLARRSDNNYYASCNRFFANKRNLSSQAQKKHWVLVDDVSDMVKVCLRWAGFKEWDVESGGVRLKERYVVPRSHSYMDIIKAAAELVGYVFFMKAPTTDDDSIGIPCFRRPTVIDPRLVGAPRATVRDTDLLTAIETKETDEPRAYIIRVRGKTAKENKGGVVLSGDRTKRLMYTYRPPWWRRLGGIVKHVVFTNNGFRSVDDCKFGCYFIALQEALQADKATCQLPILTTLELDSHLAVLDVGTGLVTRIWISERTLSFRKSEQPENSMSIGGALADTSDIRSIAAAIQDTPRSSEH